MENVVSQHLVLNVKEDVLYEIKPNTTQNNEAKL